MVTIKPKKLLSTLIQSSLTYFNLFMWRYISINRICRWDGKICFEIINKSNNYEWISIEIYFGWISIHDSHRFLLLDRFTLLIVKRLRTARPAQSAHHWCLQGDWWLVVSQTNTSAQGEGDHAVRLERQGRGWGYLVYLLDSSLK